jgi:HPt (histidine-containing phosphotransfer) domain-containing protein
MNSPLLDLSYLFEISYGDPQYVFDVLSLFIETFPPGLANLERLVRETDDFDAIHKQAHTLKSSASIIRIREVYDDITRIDMLARGATGKAEIISRLDNVLFNFRKALPLIQAERGRNQPPSQGV